MTEKRCYTVKELQEILGVSRPSMKAWTYSPQEIAELLGLTDGVVYDLLKKKD